MVYVSTSFLTGFTAALFALVSVLPSTASADTLTFCSTQNTGAGGTNYNYDWQSNGYCAGKCRAAYAYAVINYKDCWCSNYAPEAQDSANSCDGTCPGYPSEICGSNSGDRFVYFAMGNKPSGTKGGATLPTSTSKDQSSSSTLVTSVSSLPSLTSARLVTVSGQIVTETVLIPNPSPAPSGGETAQPKESTNVGAIAGGVVGGVFGLVAIVGGILFFLWRRRRQQREDGQSGVHRNVSTMSKAGLLRTEKPPQFPPPIATNINKRNSRNMMHDTDSISPVSGSDRRNSRPIIFDQRLNPSAIMTFDNTSQGSIVSMDDSRDYGRTLNVRNPDPEPRG